MTPDGPPIPDNDALAAAARRGLDDLASSDALGELSWDAVQSGARRVQRRRITALGAACAVVLLSAGIAVAATGNNDSNLRVNGNGAPTTAGETTTTSAPALPATTLATGVTPSTGTSTTLPPPSGVSAIEGTLMLASAMWVAEQPAAFTLTVRNTSDREFRLRDGLTLGIWVQGSFGVDCTGVGDPGVALAAGEQRTFTAEIAPTPELIGAADIYIAVLDASGFSSCLATDGLSGVPVVPVTIVPPGWVEGQPLDPSQGTWSATLSADAMNLGVGESTAIHVALRNAGSRPQRTDGYGSLAVICRGVGIEDGFPLPIGSVTLEPGAVQSFTVAFPVDKIGGPGTFVCSLGMTIHGVPYGSSTDRIDSDLQSIFVLSDSETTTTTTPETTTSTTP